MTPRAAGRRAYITLDSGITANLRWFIHHEMWEALGFHYSYPYKADSIYTNEGETQALGAVIDMLKGPEMGARA